MRAIFLLADAAQVSDGKINMLGGGWSVTSGTVPSALVAKLEVPWNAANEPHTLQFRLVDADGHEVAEMSQQFEVGRPPGIPVGMAIDYPVAVTLGPIPALVSGQTYVWEMRVDGHTEEAWQATFWVRPGDGNAQAA